MTLTTSTLAAILWTASTSVAAAQTLTGAGPTQTATGEAPARHAATPSAQLALPRVELGGGFTGALPVSTEGEGFFVAPMVNARVGVTLNRRWALEGVFDLWLESNGATIIYRPQARWRFRGAAAPGAFQPHLTFGTAGSLHYSSWGPFQWHDASGVVHYEPRVMRWGGMPPVYPTVGVGFQKSLGAHVALRADVAAMIIPFDDGAAVLLMPSVSLSFPIGRYETRRK